MIFQYATAIVSLIAGVVASIAGFGIGSMLTPLLALKTGIGIAVAGVSIAHFCGTAVRFFSLRKFINKNVLLRFGLASAAGGLIGALLHNILYNIVLTIIFGCLLILAGIMGLTGLSKKIHFSLTASLIAGILSGFFGGLVGNQGGIRSSVLLGFKLKEKEFVATATGIALMVDIVRIPVYLAVQAEQILSIWKLILIILIGVLIGTVAGIWILKKIPEKIFIKIVSAIILFIGIFILIHR